MITMQLMSLRQQLAKSVYNNIYCIRSASTAFCNQSIPILFHHGEGPSLKVLRLQMLEILLKLASILPEVLAISLPWTL